MRIRRVARNNFGQGSRCDPSPKSLATHSLIVEASITILAFGRSLKYSTNRSRSLRILFSINSPASVMIAIWLPFFPRSIPTCSMAASLPDQLRP